MYVFNTVARRDPVRVNLEGATRLDPDFEGQKVPNSKRYLTAHAHIGCLVKMALFAAFVAPVFPIEYPPAPVSGGYILQHESQAPQLTPKMAAGMMSSNS